MIEVPYALFFCFLLLILLCGLVMGWALQMQTSYRRILEERDRAWDRLESLLGAEGASERPGSRSLASYSVEQDGTIVGADGRRYTRDEEGNLTEVQ